MRVSPHPVPSGLHPLARGFDEGGGGGDVGLNCRAGNNTPGLVPVQISMAS